MVLAPGIAPKLETQALQEWAMGTSHFGPCRWTQLSQGLVHEEALPAYPGAGGWLNWPGRTCQRRQQHDLPEY